jgi:hypothetical protein
VTGTRLLAAGALALGLAGCGTDGLSFRLDERVELEAPADHADVTLPVTVRWTVEDFAVGEGVGAFGVLVDRTPPPPGQGLEWLFRDDDSCVGVACADPAFQAQRGVYRTTEPELVLAEVTTRPDRGDADQHEVTVVLLDRDGHRVGEGAWSRQFELVGRP